ncbi:radical SAM/SPASM domain-containing protein [Fusibacter sp. 3D3]|uniref:radical SAM/SPASM domain-containing protein n=1 Tax=Fusibacter sp. 3D3 TaxID=1048380 RepID=UPI0008560332|nr:radical SAM protein [Fusibacter sp. 3D3]GAU75655.1 radical SAM [Fusibacter sp. 3D3]
MQQKQNCESEFNIMKANIKASYDSTRKNLSEIIPLSIPMTVFIEPTRYCNLKCFYCIHSTKTQNGKGFDKSDYLIKHMSNDLHEKIIYDLNDFNLTLKRIVYSGLGEPLMNPLFPQFIRKSRKNCTVERIDLLTNATLLTPKLSDEIVNAGISRIQISLQGLNSEQYLETSNQKIDFKNFYQNIEYLYKHKKESIIFIKIIDALLKNKSNEKEFYSLFGNISDQIFIEHLITLQHQMGDHDGKADNSRNLNNELTYRREVCPVIFYMLQIDVDGNVFPCPVSGLPPSFSIGNIKENSLKEIWNGDKRKALILQHLHLERKENPTCARCESCATVMDEREFLDDVASDLIRRF